MRAARPSRDVFELRRSAGPPRPDVGHSPRAGGFPRTGRPAFTLVELMVVTGVIAILMSLILPAVQNAREAARRTSCQNNLKNIALAGLNFESTHQRLPGAWFDSHPNDTPDTGYRGLFVELLPYLDGETTYQAIDRTRPVNSPANADLVATLPPVLKCPSAGDSAVLKGLSAEMSGPAVPGLDSPAPDYTGNGGEVLGMIDGRYAHLDGSVDFHIGRVADRRRVADLLDGASNTFFFWDSAGDQMYPVVGDPRPVDDATRQWTFIPIGTDDGDRVDSRSQASCKAYFRSWLGIHQGGVYGYDGTGAIRNRRDGYTHLKTINASNELHAPYSLHAGGANFALADGSVRFLAERSDQNVILDMASGSGET